MATNAPAESASATHSDVPLVGGILRRRRVPAWLMSLVLHATLVLALALTLEVAPRGGPVEQTASGGIVLVKHSDGHREYFDGGDESSVPQQSPTVASEKMSATALPSTAELPVDLSGVLPSTGDLVGTGNVGGVLPNAGELTVGSGPGRAPGGSTKTQVFGVQGSGSKFIYVFDRSGSMGGHRKAPLRAAKSELIASLADLDKIHQFQIIFYNERPNIFNPSGSTPRLIWGDQRGKTLAGRFVQSIVAAGGTRHMEALTMAVKLRPDVIFFLTDAKEPQMTEEQLQTIRRLNRHAEASINTIEFGYGAADKTTENFLVRLARENHGQHVYVDISKLPP